MGNAASDSGESARQRLRRWDSDSLSLKSALLKAARLPSLDKAKSARLTSLDVSENSLSRLPDDLGSRCPLLRELLAGGNCLSALPDSLASLERLKTLSVPRNSLVRVPPCVFSLSLLVELELQGNGLQELPAQVTRLANLKHLNVNRNQLQELPEQLGALQSLVSLNVSFNELRRVPDSVSTIPTLRFFFAASNRLSELPKGLCLMQSLDQIVVDHNELSSLPVELNDLFKLTFLEARHNRILEVPPVFHTNVTLYFDPPSQMEPRLFLGNVSCSANMEVLRHHKVSHVLRIIDVRSQASEPFPDQLVYYSIDAEDLPEQRLLHHFGPAIAFIERALREGTGILVHCKQGKSRSASIVAAYMIHKHQESAGDALRRVRSKRRLANPNRGFKRQLRQFAKEQFNIDASSEEGEEDGAPYEPD